MHAANQQHCDARGKRIGERATEINLSACRFSFPCRFQGFGVGRRLVSEYETSAEKVENPLAGQSWALWQDYASLWT